MSREQTYNKSLKRRKERCASKNCVEIHAYFIGIMKCTCTLAWLEYKERNIIELTANSKKWLCVCCYNFLPSFSLSGLDKKYLQYWDTFSIHNGARHQWSFNGTCALYIEDQSTLYTNSDKHGELGFIDWLAKLRDDKRFRFKVITNSLFLYIFMFSLITFLEMLTKYSSMRGEVINFTQTNHSSPSS